MLGAASSADGSLATLLLAARAPPGVLSLFATASGATASGACSTGAATLSGAVAGRCPGFSEVGAERLL